MDEKEIMDKKDQLNLVFSTNDILQIKEAVEDFPPALIVEILEEKENDEIINIFKVIESETAGKVFSYLSIEMQYELSQLIGKRKFSTIFSCMYSDSRADLYQEFTKEEQIAILPYLDKKTREDVIVLSAYEPDTAGGIMNTDFATVLIHMTCLQALAKIRQDAPSQKMIYYIYVVNDDMELLGLITIKDLILSDPRDIVKELFNADIFDCKKRLLK